jgi:hypothetical protein
MFALIAALGHSADQPNKDAKVSLKIKGMDLGVHPGSVQSIRLHYAYSGTKPGSSLYVVLSAVADSHVVLQPADTRVSAKDPQLSFCGTFSTSRSGWFEIDAKNYPKSMPLDVDQYMKAYTDPEAVMGKKNRCDRRSSRWCRPCPSPWRRMSPRFPRPRTWAHIPSNPYRRQALCWSGGNPRSPWNSNTIPPSRVRKCMSR